jgi:hypothetical protein
MNQKTVFKMSLAKKKSIVLSIVLLAFVNSGLYAQKELTIGIKAGADLMKISGRSMDNKFQAGFSGGAYGEYKFNKSWSLQPELLYQGASCMTTDEFNAIYPGGISSKVYLNYISLPVLVAFKPVPELSVLAGPQFGYLVSQTTGLLPPPQDNKNAFSTTDFSLIFGGQLNLNKVKIGIRYSIGLNNINAINSSDDWRKYGFQFYVGYQLWKKH